MVQCPIQMLFAGRRVNSAKRVEGKMRPVNRVVTNHQMMSWCSSGAHDVEIRISAAVFSDQVPGRKKNMAIRTCARVEAINRRRASRQVRASEVRASSGIDYVGLIYFPFLQMGLTFPVRLAVHMTADRPTHERTTLRMLHACLPPRLLPCEAKCNVFYLPFFEGQGTKAYAQARPSELHVHTPFTTIHGTTLLPSMLMLSCSAALVSAKSRPSSREMHRSRYLPRRFRFRTVAVRRFVGRGAIILNSDREGQR